MITIDDAIWKVLVGIYSSDLLSEKMYLKGGQALRVTQNLKTRLSKDSDFSVEGKIDQTEAFFRELKDSVSAEFLRDGFYVIDFTFTRKPKFKSEGLPDFWQGWEVEFKLITREQLTLPSARQSATAIIPEGSQSSKISVDISEMEYCGSFEVVKVKSVDIRVYSRVLLAIEKLRAICQSHPDYKFRSRKSNRARDFYDIEQLYTKAINDGAHDDFISQCKMHLGSVFKAKEVPVELIDKCLNEKEFIEGQKYGWEEVKNTVAHTQDFSYYLQTLKDITRLVLSK